MIEAVVDGPRGKWSRGRLSPSAIDRYRRCPRQFWFQHVAGNRPAERPSPMLVQANAVHHALERFFGLPVDDRTVENLHRALRSVWPQHRRRDSFSSREQEADFGRGALAMLSVFHENFDVSTLPLAREQWVSCELPNGVEVYGKVDRVDISRSGGGLEVIDYKTGRRRLEPEDLAQEAAALVYIVAAAKRFQKPVDRLRLIYLATGDETRWEPETEDVDLALARLVEMTDRIAADDAFDALPAEQCQWCPFAHLCPDRGRVSVGDLEVPEHLPF